MTLPVVVFFSGKLAPPKEETVVSKEVKAATLPYTGFFNDLLVPPKADTVPPKEERATVLPFSDFFDNLLAPPKEPPCHTASPAPSTPSPLSL